MMIVTCTEKKLFGSKHIFKFFEFLTDSRRTNVMMQRKIQLLIMGHPVYTEIAVGNKRMSCLQEYFLNRPIDNSP